MPVSTTSTRRLAHPRRPGHHDRHEQQAEDRVELGEHVGRRVCATPRLGIGGAALTLPAFTRVRTRRAVKAANADGCLGGHGGVTLARLSPMTPARISPMDTSFSVDADSPSAHMPTTAVPAAPIPVHTA